MHIWKCESSGNGQPFGSSAQCAYKKHTVEVFAGLSPGWPEEKYWHGYFASEKATKPHEQYSARFVGS